jgi:hypothetical protein
MLRRRETAAQWYECDKYDTDATPRGAEICRGTASRVELRRDLLQLLRRTPMNRNLISHSPARLSAMRARLRMGWSSFTPSGAEIAKINDFDAVHVALRAVPI